MKTFRQKYLKWIILAILLSIIVITTYALLTNKLTNFDTAVYSAVMSIKHPIVTGFFKAITFCSSKSFLIVLSILLFFIFKNKKYPLFSFISLAFIALSNKVLKFIFQRERPDWKMIPEDGFSFPSGHAMASMAFYGLLIYLIWRTDIPKKYKKILTVVLSILIFLVGLSRIYLGVHYASDIIVGFAISLSYLIVITTIITYYLKRHHE